MEHLPYISSQVRKDELIPSIIENNTRTYVLDQAWENEWSSIGIDSGLEEDGYREEKKGKILKEMGVYIREHMQDGEEEDDDIDAFLNSFQGN